MAKENETDWGKFFGKILWAILKFLWKLFLMLSWGILRITELLLGQFAKWLKASL